MSVNFGYGGMGMMNGMNMMNGMQSSSGSTGNTFQEFHAKYGCEQCDRFMAVPYPYQMNVSPAPQAKTNSTFMSRLLKLFTG